MKDGQRSLLGYLPAQVIKCVLDGKIASKPHYPLEIPLQTVSLFADISGFTKLSEKFSKKGRTGPEFLAFCLNRYMEQLINIIGKNGGDIFKFAGDALLVIWPRTDGTSLEESCRRALQCAITIKSKLHKLDMGSGNPLSVKVGIGVGECRIFFVGGTFNRSEYLIVGTAMKQACSSECHCSEGGQIVVSEKVYDEINQYYEFSQCEKDTEHPDTDDMNYYFYDGVKESNNTKLRVRADAFLMRTKFSQEKIAENMGILRTFIPAAVTGYLDIENESWCKELRNLTIMFVLVSVDLKDTETPAGRDKIQNVVSTVQRCVYCTRGSLNKFLMDDKGSVMLNCWGLPPFSSPDDPVRAVMSAVLIVNELKDKFHVNARIGITTGCCFSGVCGCSGGRREYSLLGEIVNLSARFMQTAIKVYDVDKNNPEFASQQNKKSIYLCEKTRNMIQNKITCEYRLNMELKGFSVRFDHFSPIDEQKKQMSEDEIYRSIKTHRNNSRTDSTYLRESENKEEKAIGVDYEISLIKNVFEKVNSTSVSEAILIRGMIGSGKSLLVRSTLLNIINTKTEYFSNLDRSIFISNQSPISHTVKFNGFRDAMIKMFKTLLTINNPESKKYAIGDVIVEGDLIFNMIYTTGNYVNIHYIEEILNYDFGKHYTVLSSGGTQKFQIEQLDKCGDPFFFVRSYEKNKVALVEFFIMLLMKYQKHVLKEKPIIFVVEDTQRVDSLSVEFIKAFLRRKNEIKKVLMICTYQTVLCGLKDIEREKSSKLNNEIDDSFIDEPIILMRPMINIKHITSLIQYNVTKMTKETTSGGGIRDPKDLYEEIHIDEISHEVIQALLPMSFKGNPLFLIEITQELLNQNLLYLKSRTTLSLSDELKTMLFFKDFTKMQVPFLVEKVLGNIIDSLKCTEIIILKHASVIGNIFDIDTLSSIISLPSITFDDLIEMIKNFESQGIIQILYDTKPKRMVAMFAIPLLREILYQRMLVEQKTPIHDKVARKMQFTKFSYMSKEKENAVLKRHLEKAEKTIMNHLEENNEDSTPNLNNAKILTTKEIIEKLKIIDLKIESSYSTVKKQFMPMLLSATISKKDEHGGKEEDRFAVLTNTKMCYYYYDSNYNDNSEPLASFYLKNIYQICILNRSQYKEKKFYMEIKVSSWFKKDIMKGDRTFIIGFSTNEELYKWEISLNFLRIKNMYDEFTSNFGMIQLPLNQDYNAFSDKKYKRKLVIKRAVNKQSSLNVFSVNKTKSFMRKKTISNISTSLGIDTERQEVDKANLKIVNENSHALVFNGFAVFFGKIMIRVKGGKDELEWCPEMLGRCSTPLKMVDKKFKDFVFEDNEQSSQRSLESQSKKSNNS